MSLSKYALRVTAMTAASLAVAWPLVLRAPEAGTPTAVVFGAVLALLNTVTAYGLVEWSRDRATTAFMGAVLGGMLGRMAFLLAAIVAGILGLGLPRLPLVLSVLSYFTLFLVFELNVVNRTIRTRVRA